MSLCRTGFFSATQLSVIMLPLYGYCQNDTGIVRSNSTRIKLGPDWFDSLIEHFFRQSEIIDPNFLAR